ncbi:MAG TPA: response regulator, partial [Gemmatimonadaceae bacterium]
MSKTVLVVEDSALFQKAYAAALQSYARDSLEVLYASNGQEALAQVEQRPAIDLIVLDVNMPVMDGPAFLERLRRDYASLEIPVMFASTRAYAMRDTIGDSAGVVAYLQKPFAPRELHALLDGIWSWG